MTKSKYLFFY